LIRRQYANNKRPEVIPNYYSYQLKVNNRALTNAQAKHFFECINIIHRENHKVIYRGDKKDKLLQLYNIEINQFPEKFNNTVFITGAKGRMFLSSQLPEDEIINIADAAHNEFALIFVMLHSLLKRELRFSARRTALVGFRDRENGFTTYFRDINNRQDFIDKMIHFSQEEKVLLRDYYLALLHHMDISKYYTSSFLLSTTSNFGQAQKFAWKNESQSSTNPIILFGWVPQNFEGLLSTPRTNTLKQKINFRGIEMPLYETSFFPYQAEVTLKGGLLPHYFLGYLHNIPSGEIFEINPALFHTTANWNGVELPIDQSSFYERIRDTRFAQYFTVDNGRFDQHLL
jgi:hypothetical protein